jgi:hypothetical protein
MGRDKMAKREGLEERREERDFRGFVGDLMVVNWNHLRGEQGS